MINAAGNQQQQLRAICRPKADLKRCPLSVFRLNSLPSIVFTPKADISGGGRLGGNVPKAD